MLRFFDVIYEGNYNFKQKIAYLETCAIAGSFIGEDPGDIEDVTKKIKALLGVPSSRTEGLALLLAFLPQCSAEVFAANAISWVQANLRIIQERSSAKDKSLACSLLRKLIPFTVSFPELSKSVATNTIPPLIQALLRITPEHDWKERGLELLETCFNCFPGSCGKYKFDFERLAIEFLDQWHGETLKHVSSCIASIPFLGGSGNQGINHSESWHNQLMNILNSMNHIIDALYNGEEIAEGIELIISNTEIPQPESSDPLLRIFQSSRIYEFLSLCLVQMMSKQTTARVKVPVEFVLTHVCKALSVNINEMAAKPSVEAVAIASIMTTIHSSCLRVLESLICCSKNNLIPQAKVITDLLLQTLNWSLSDENIIGFDRPYSSLRKETYRVITIWSQVVGCSSGLHLCADQFFSHVAYDFKPQVLKHKLQSRGPSTSSESQRYARKRKAGSTKDFGLDQMLGDTNLRKINSTANRETVIAALKALEAVIYSCGPSIDAKVWKNIHLSVIGLLLQVQQQSWKYPIPYSSPQCRRALYKVLQACVLGCNISSPPPIAVAVAIFSTGRIDENEQVAYTCMESLAICDSLIHPKVSPLQQIMPKHTNDSRQYQHSADESNATEEIMESEYYSNESMANEDDSSQSIPENLKRPNMPKPASVRNEELMRKNSQPSIKIPPPKRAEPERQAEDVVLLLSEENESEEEHEEIVPTPRMNLAKIEALERMGGENCGKPLPQGISPAPPKHLLNALKAAPTPVTPSVSITSQNIEMSQNVTSTHATINPSIVSNSSSSQVHELKVRPIRGPHQMAEKHRIMQTKEIIDEMQYNEDDDSDMDEEEIYDEEEEEHFYKGRVSEGEEELEETYEGEYDVEIDDENNEDEDEEVEEEEDEYQDMNISSEDIQGEHITFEKFNSTEIEAVNNVPVPLSLSTAAHHSTLQIVSSTTIMEVPDEIIPEIISEEHVVLETQKEENEVLSTKDTTEVESMVSTFATSQPCENEKVLIDESHLDENGIVQNEEIRDCHLVDLSDCHITDESILSNEPVIQSAPNSASETAGSPASVVRSEAGLVLEHALEQIETNDNLNSNRMDHSNSELTHQVKVLPVRDKGNADMIYQSVTKTKCIEEDEVEDILPPLKVMKDAFDSSLKDV